MLLSRSAYDFIIVGAGIVGMTVARRLKQHMPHATIAIIDKENRIGVHASGRNSGVLHCGIYYANDTLKASACAKGAAEMYNFAQEHNLPCSKSGKVIIATSDSQLTTIDSLMQNARQNGIKAQKINQQELFDLEPAAAKTNAAIFCPDTAVIDGNAVLEKLKSLLSQAGVDFIFGCQVKGVKNASQLITTHGPISYGFLYNCAGTHADTLARSYGLAENYALIPFKGIYWKLSPEANHLVRGNIYPVPDVSLPFLGIHLTRVMSGDVYVGPTAIPVFGRENYRSLEGINIRDAINICSYLALMYLSNKNNFRLLTKIEIAKYKKKTFLTAAQNLVPSLQEKDLLPTPKVGIRPQLINIKTRKLEMDYIFEKSEKSIHVLNAISPAFTSSFAFAEIIINESGIF